MKTKGGNSIRWDNKSRDQAARIREGKHSTVRLDPKLMEVSPALAVAQHIMQDPTLTLDEAMSATKRGLRALKRKPLLVDEFLAAPLLKVLDKQERRTMDAVREHLREAKKFVLDEKAAVYAAEFIRDHPEAIAYDQEFAIPPFPRMYIEFPYPNFYEKLGGIQVHDPIMGDTEVGYFIDGPNVYVLTRLRGGWHDNEIKAVGAVGMVMPVRYRLNRPFTMQEEQEACAKMKVSRLGLDVLYWGTSLALNWHGKNITSDLNDPAARSRVLDELSKAPDTDAVRTPPESRLLRANHSFEVWYGKQTESALGGLLKASAGDLRNIIALLLFMNRTADVRFDDEIPPHRGWIGPKPAVFTKHNVVRFKLDPKPSLIKVYGGKGAWRRRHAVKGHFCHDKKARANNHHIIPHPYDGITHQPQWTEYDVNRWRCLVCGGKRWHRNACSRGSKDKGQVVKTYEVTK